MLEILGNLNGKTFEKPTIIAAAEFARLYGSIMPIKTEDPIYRLDILPSKITFDPRRDSHERIPQSFTVPPIFSANLADGSSFTLRYYNSKVDQGNGAAVYGPDNLTFRDRTMTFNTTGYERFVYLSASPWCATSQIAKSPHWHVYDPEKIQRAEELKADQITALINSVQSASDVTILAKSAGISIDGRFTNIGLTQPIPIHRSALLKMAIDAPEKFMNAWYNDENDLRGIIRLGIDKGVFQQSVNNGRPVWELKDRTVLTFFVQDQDPMDALYRWASANESNRQEAMNYVAAGLGVKDVISKVAKEIALPPAASKEGKGNEFMEVVVAAKDRGTVFMDAGVVLIRKGEGDAEQLFTPVNKKEWKEELAEMIRGNADLYNLVSEA